MKIVLPLASQITLWARLLQESSKKIESVTFPYLLKLLGQVPYAPIFAPELLGMCWLSCDLNWAWRARRYASYDILSTSHLSVVFDSFPLLSMSQLFEMKESKEKVDVEEVSSTSIDSPGTEVIQKAEEVAIEVVSPFLSALGSIYVVTGYLHRRWP